MNTTSKKSELDVYRGCTGPMDTSHTAFFLVCGRVNVGTYGNLLVFNTLILFCFPLVFTLLKGSLSCVVVPMA